MNFSIPEKSIYQMGFNSGGPSAVPNYVTESNHITNPLHILEILNPATQDADDKNRQIFAELMTPHYEKQVEIEKKIDDLSETLNHFIRAQQSINELILGKYVGQNHESPQNIEESEKMDEQINEENMNTEQSPEQIFEHPPINNPMPIYAVPLCVNHESAHSPIRNRSISPEKMDSEISVRDFLKSNMTVQKADDKILEMERERDREEEAQLVKYNKFRVRNRPKKYKRSAVTVTKTFTTTTSSSSASDSGTSATPSNSVAPPPPPPPPPPPSQQQQQPQFILEESPRNSAEIHELHEESAFQPVLRSSELELTRMPPVFPTTSSYVLNSSHSAHQTHDLTALTAEKFQTDQNNIWKAVDNVTQLLVDAPSLLESDFRAFADHSNQSSFLPFMGSNQDHHPRSAFVPPNYHKDRLIQMDPNGIETLRNL